MMSTSFLSLLKEEPVTDGSDMDSSNGRVAISRPIGRAAPVANDSQIQGLPISPLTPNTMQPPALIRTDVDPNFEPVPRGRCNTWPLLPEGFMESEDPPGMDPTTAGDVQRSQGGGLGESPNTGPPKKNTSRRNPWGNMSYADLIAQAIVSSNEGRATLSQIYDWMVQNVPYFKDKGDSNSSAGWKNSIRHNLSLHNRFMRMQNEGTGKSSWWVLNPDAKPGKSTRRRANTLEGSRLEKKRGRVRKKVDGIRNSIEAPASPNLSEGIEYYPGSPSGGPLHHPFQLSPQDYRPRASSNASSCGRLSPIIAIEADMHDSQVPPMSPGVVGWAPDYWSANNHAHTSHQNHLGHHIHEPYTDRLVESIGEGLKLSARETWAPHHAMGPHGGSTDCLKIPHPHHHMNGFIAQSHSQPPPGYGSFDDYSGFVPPNSQCGGYSHSHPPPKEKHSIRRAPHLTPFHIPPLLPLSSNHNSHNVSPTNPIADSHFSPPSCEQEMKPSPSFSSPPPRNTNPSTSHNTPPTTHHHTPPTDQQETGVETPKTTAASPSTSSSTLQPINSHPLMYRSDRSDSESTTMLRVALSHREASCTINGIPHYRQNGMGQLHPGHPGIGANDLVDLDNIQGGLECNVEEVIKHELQYEEDLNFDFQHGQSSSYPHPHSYSHRDPAGGPSGPVQVYSCSSIPRGNHWVR